MADKPELWRKKLGAGSGAQASYSALRMMPDGAIAQAIKATLPESPRLAWALWRGAWGQVERLWGDDSEGSWREPRCETLPEAALRRGDKVLARAGLSLLRKKQRGLSAMQTDRQARRALERLLSALEAGPLREDPAWARRCLAALGGKAARYRGMASEGAWLASRWADLGQWGLAREAIEALPARVGEGGEVSEGWRYGQTDFDRGSWEEEALARAGGRGASGRRVTAAGKAWMERASAERDGLLRAWLERGAMPTAEMIKDAFAGEAGEFGEGILKAVEARRGSLGLGWEEELERAKARALLAALARDDLEEFGRRSERIARALGRPAPDPWADRISRWSDATFLHASLALGAKRCAREWLEKAQKLAWKAAPMILEVRRGALREGERRLEGLGPGPAGEGEWMAVFPSGLARMGRRERDGRGGKEENLGPLAEADALSGRFDIGALGLLSGDAGLAERALRKTRHPGKSLEMAAQAAESWLPESQRAEWEALRLGVGLSAGKGRRGAAKAAEPAPAPARRSRKV